MHAARCLRVPIVGSPPDCRPVERGHRSAEAHERVQAVAEVVRGGQVGGGVGVSGRLDATARKSRVNRMDSRENET